MSKHKWCTKDIVGILKNMLEFNTREPSDVIALKRAIEWGEAELKREQGISFDIEGQAKEHQHTQTVCQYCNKIIAQCECIGDPKTVEFRVCGECERKKK